MLNLLANGRKVDQRSECLRFVTGQGAVEPPEGDVGPGEKGEE
jgi:hypothetical protein